MCRLLGYTSTEADFSLQDALGSAAVASYRELSEIHNDGWGCSLLSVPVDPLYRYDGGAFSPETETRLYKSTVAARHDSAFAGLAKVSARGALWHLRLASSHLPLILENQQPFFANGLSFSHNGDISDECGRNIVTNRDYPVSRDVVLSTGGSSDSAIFFAVILEYIGFGFQLDGAVAQAVRELRRTYPKSSYNCMVQSRDQLVALRASGREETADRIVELYERYGRGSQALDYRTMRYRGLIGAKGSPAGVVVASSGFDQPESEGWRVLNNDQMLVASSRSGKYRIRSL